MARVVLPRGQEDFMTRLKTTWLAGLVLPALGVLTMEVGDSVGC